MLSVLQPRYQTTCKLCKKAIAEMPALKIPLVGEPPPAALDLMKILFKHLGKHHPQEMQEGAMLAKELPAYLILSAFDHEDPSMGPRLEMIRAAIFALVRKNSMSDDNLAYIVSGLGLDKDDEQKVNEAFRAVRDAVCEFGQFAPQQVQESRIIPV